MTATIRTVDGNVTQYEIDKEENKNLIRCPFGLYQMKMATGKTETWFNAQNVISITFSDDK